MMKIKALFLSALLLTLSVATASAMELGSGNNVEIHGFVTQGYIGSTDNNFFGRTENGTAQFNERGLNFGSDVSDRLHMGIQIFSRDFGSVGNDKLTIDWAYADYTIVDAFNLRAGKVKINHGFYNTGRDVDMLRNSILLPQSVYNEGWRDSVNALNGLELYGYAYAGFMGSFEYHLQGGVVTFDDGGAENRLLEDQAPYWMQMDVETIDNRFTAAAAFVWETPVEGLRIGASGWQIHFDAPTTVNNMAKLGKITEAGLTAMKNSTPLSIPDSVLVMPTRINTFFDVTLTSWAASLEYAVGDFILSSEYNKINYDLYASMDKVGIPDFDQNFDAEGYYLGFSYRVTDWFELGTYYSEYYPYGRENKDGSDRVKKWTTSRLGTGGEGGFPEAQKHRAYLKDLALTLRFDITENWIFKLEGHKMDGAAMMLNTDGNTKSYGPGIANLPITGPSYEKDWYLYTAKVTFSF